MCLSSLCSWLAVLCITLEISCLLQGLYCISVNCMDNAEAQFTTALRVRFSSQTIYCGCSVWKWACCNCCVGHWTVQDGRESWRSSILVACVLFFFLLCWSQFRSGRFINSKISGTKSVIYMGWANSGLDAEVFDCAVGIVFILAHYTSRTVGIYCDKLSQCVHQGRQPASRGKLVSDCHSKFRNLLERKLLLCLDYSFFWAFLQSGTLSGSQATPSSG